MRIGIFYCGRTGNTALIAKRLAELVSTARLYPIADAVRADLEAYDLLILGTSSWHDEGDRLQSDWNDAYDCLREARLEGKKVALYGLGDQICYPDAFVDGMKALHDLAVAAGAALLANGLIKTTTTHPQLLLKGIISSACPLMSKTRTSLPSNVWPLGSLYCTKKRVFPNSWASTLVEA